MKGIDVSEHQGIIDWDKVKSQIDFAILRLGWIGNNSNKIDAQFERNYAECKRLNIPVGVYVYNYVKTSQRAKECATWVLEQLRDKKLDLPVYIDMEDSSIKSLGKNILTIIVQSFNGVIEKKGLWAGVYANLDWFNNYLHKEDLKKQYTTWIAHYGVREDRYKGEYDILQYSSSGSISGIKGKVDMDNMYRDLITEIAGNVPRETKTNQEIANEVINGLWGNGDERRKKITDAGYDYNAIQKIVNDKLNPHNYYTACLSKYNSFVDGLKSIGVNSGYENRKRIAAANGIKSYTGTAEQNSKLLKLLKEGKLKKY